MTAVAAILDLKSFNLIKTWPELANKTDDEFDEYLAERGLLWRENPCPSCQESRKISKQKNASGAFCKQKFECYKRACRNSRFNCKTGYLKGTFFEGLRGSRKKIFLCSFLYLNGKMVMKELAETLETEEKTVIQWCQWFRDIMAESLYQPAIMIGGVGETVQIDETNIVKRKYNVGRIVRNGWLIGGIQNNTRAVFIEIVDKRDQATCERIIQQYVAPGTTVITDCWRGYNGLAALGYDHKTVNHSQNFVDPATGLHTQRVESLWSHLKRRIKPKCGLKGDLWDDHWFEALWHFKHHEEAKLYELWAEIARRYPLT
ncbi:hypothetical protein L3Y34_000446 [Caenorhabditis briggsae]|uniref:ISXO2-like transposase domain-containing protein n=1 Tax=Caenorhabditis briggsae TaxID=6238 RepID=A0AAE9D995_CAEBR|nr:hypothetical protein L3Y34_000446 [Caenorhabditis briggsae]